MSSQAKCPVAGCGAPIDIDQFPCICAKCGANLYVEFDGTIRQVELEAVASAESSGVTNEALEASISSEDPVVLFAADESETHSYEEPRTEEPQETSFFSQEAQAPESVFHEEELVSENPETSTQFGSLDDLFSSPTTGSELGNTPFVYTLWILGIDNGETSRKVQEILSDVRLNLIFEELPVIIINDKMDPKRAGSKMLEIRNLNPVRTSVIVNRLREDRLEFRWKQGPYSSESDSPSEDSQSGDSGESAETSI